ncbi:hypothetical protein BYT27DRAFT_7179554 [Phlegmacium glaucopus]|nr:hypothetical protein BYT27DRAFT_7179554 [Phlegmacium glaucopus]
MKGKSITLPDLLASPNGIITYGQYVQLVVQSSNTLTTARHVKNSHVIPVCEVWPKLERCINAACSTR